MNWCPQGPGHGVKLALVRNWNRHWDRFPVHKSAGKATGKGLKRIFKWDGLWNRDWDQSLGGGGRDDQCGGRALVYARRWSEGGGAYLMRGDGVIASLL